MEELFRKFCYYYATDDKTISLEELKKEYPKDFKKYQKKAQKYIKSIKKSSQKLGYKTDFESFCNLLEEYINQKEKMTNMQKKEYLKVLYNLSKIYDVNLREELEPYISNQPKKTIINEKEIFKAFCLYNLQEESDVKTFNKIKKMAQDNNLNYTIIQQKSIAFIEDIKKITEKLGFSTKKEDIYKMIDTYQNNKYRMNDKEKSTYLKILLYLTTLYNINLRKILSNKEKKLSNNDIDLTNLNDPLSNEELLSNLLTQRYQEGNFDVENIVLPNYKIIKESKNFDYNRMQANLTYKLYNIFLEKFNNYAYDDLNPIYTSLLGEEELQKLKEIDENTIYEIIKEVKNHESSHYIIKKYKLTDKLYNFIYLSLTEVTNLNEDHPSMNNRSLFTNNNDLSTIAIYLNGPEYENILLLNEYIKECVKCNVNYDMLNINTWKYLTLYANSQDIKIKLDILNNIKKYKPELIENFGSPFPLSSIPSNSFYGLSSIGLYDSKKENYIPYHIYLNDLLEVAYYRIIAKLVINQIPDEKAKNMIDNFIKLINVTLSTSYNPLEAKYNNVSFTIIKDIINQYIPSISNTLSIYMNKQEEKKILINEFKKSIIYIDNIINKKDKKDKSNIAFNSLIN